MLAPPDKDLITDLFDVIMLNRYYGWYIATGDLAAAERELEAELNAWATKYDKPIIITEYGADTVAGLHSVLAAPWTRTTRLSCWRCRIASSTVSTAVVGEQVWAFADFATRRPSCGSTATRKGSSRANGAPRSQRTRSGAGGEGSNRRSVAPTD